MNPSNVNEALAIRDAVTRIIRTSAGGYDGKINTDAARGAAERLLNEGVINTFVVSARLARDTAEEEQA